jgi:hypothetical protein
MIYQYLSMQSVRLASKSVLALALMVTGVSCVSPQPLDATFRANRNQRVAVVTMQAPKATVHNLGGQGILDVVLNQAFTAKSRKRIEDYPSQAKLDAVGAQLAQRLRAAGYKADLLGQHPEASTFNVLFAKPSAQKPIPGEGSYLKGYDAALFVSLPMVGQCQQVYGFIPLSGRSPIAPLNGAMFATGSQKLLYRAPQAQLVGGAECGSEDMETIFRTIDAELQKSRSALESDLAKGL